MDLGESEPRTEQSSLTQTRPTHKNSRFTQKKTLSVQSAKVAGVSTLFDQNPNDQS